MNDDTTPTEPFSPFEAFPWEDVGAHAPDAAPIAKRVEDIILGSMFLAIAAVPMIFIAIALKLTNPNQSVFFSQWRHGIKGRRFKILKFRTMRVSEDGASVTQATKEDNRVTKLGKLLRKTSLDEFPQFIQVVTGELSLVGPRPHAIAHDEYYRTRISGYILRYVVKPGITGWAQINGYRGPTETIDKMQKRIEHDLVYIRNWSVIEDIKIVFRTIFSSKTRQNAF